MNDDNNVSPMLMRVLAASVIDTKGYKIGSLYKVKDFYWLLFPSKEFISAATSGCAFKNLTVAAKVYGKVCKCTLPYLSPEDIFVLLEVDDDRMKALTPNGENGWFHLADFFFNKYFEEVKRND
jgi:hypothetical protein